MLVFLKEFFEKVNFEKSQQTTTKHDKISSMQRLIVNRYIIHYVEKH